MVETLKPGKIVEENKPEQTNPVLEQMKELNARYDRIMDDIKKILTDEDCGPIEIFRIANELQAVALEGFADNTGNFVVNKIKEAMENSKE